MDRRCCASRSRTGGPRTRTSTALSMRYGGYSPRSVKGGLQPDNQYAEQGANGGAQQAASQTESTAAASQEAVDRQQHGARDDCNPGSGTDLDADDLGDDQDQCRDQRRGQDRPGLGEGLFQCTDRMRSMLDRITQGSSVEVRQPVDERRSENGQNEV